MLLYIEPSDLDMNNKSIKIPKSLENKLMIVMVLADWCGHCKNSMPEFEKAVDGGDGKIVLIDATKDT